jgi:hypothetical protein
MLRLAATTSADVVYDLGSGDGRVVIGAARDFGSRGVGVELDPALVQVSREAALRAGVADRVRFLWADIFATDVSEATVVTLYLGADLNRRLRPKLLGELRPGSRVVSHDFDMGDWAPDRSIQVRSPARPHALHLWVIPADAGGPWRSQAGPSLDLVQRYQEVSGHLRTPGGPVEVRGRLAGDQVTLEGSGWRLQARIAGVEAAGRLTAPDGTAADWRARRVGP